MCDHKASTQVVTLQLGVMPVALIEEGCGKMQMKRPVRQKDNGINKHDVVKPVRKWSGKRNKELSWDSKMQGRSFHDAQVHNGQIPSFILIVCFNTHTYTRTHTRTHTHSHTSTLSCIHIVHKRMFIHVYTQMLLFDQKRCPAVCLLVT